MCVYVSFAYIELSFGVWCNGSIEVVNTLNIRKLVTCFYNYHRKDNYATCNQVTGCMIDFHLLSCY